MTPEEEIAALKKKLVDLCGAVDLFLSHQGPSYKTERQWVEEALARARA